MYLKIADSFFDQGSYEKAISRYMQFTELYPGHKEVSRAKFQVGLAYFNQIKNTDLDSTVVQRATKSFKTSWKTPTQRNMRRRQKKSTRNARKKLAEKEIYKARTYVNMGNYQAARLAAQRVLDEYPKAGFDEEANNLIEKSKTKNSCR